MLTLHHLLPDDIIALLSDAQIQAIHRIDRENKVDSASSLLGAVRQEIVAESAPSVRALLTALVAALAILLPQTVV